MAIEGTPFMNTLDLDPRASGGGCGGGSCGCASTAPGDAPVGTAVVAQDLPVASVNGVLLHAPDQTLSIDEVRELAYAELLRQRAVTLGLLPKHDGPMAPELGEAEREVLEAMVEREVASPEPQESECQRYYEAHAGQFTVGQAVRLRHILFAVTPGINVQALAVHAEKALLELCHKDTPASRFAKLAGELSNCPSSAQGGDLGWVGPDDCAPELARTLFQGHHSGLGMHPTLVHSRFGFHVVDVLERRDGIVPSYEEVRERIERLLTVQSRGRALYQYMTLLAGEAELQNVELVAADSPLVQ